MFQAALPLGASGDAVDLGSLLARTGRTTGGAPVVGSSDVRTRDNRSRV